MPESEDPNDCELIFQSYRIIILKIALDYSVFIVDHPEEEIINI